MLDLDILAVVEYRRVGVMEIKSNTPALQYSITPVSIRQCNRYAKWP